MPEEKKTYRIFISAAEPSGDAHCAELITALNETGYNFEFTGVGGPKMAEAGCKLLETTIKNAAMAYKAFGQIFYFYKLIKRITSFLETNKHDLVIVCDSPAFNFNIAKAAKKLEIKTLFYVAPQLWAWGGWRIKKLKSCCDKLCCILPFEQDWFSQKDVDTTFVGNPLLDKMNCDLAKNEKKYTDFDPKTAKIALMPGSRTAEIDSLWRPMQQIAIRIKRGFPNINITTVAVDEERKEILKTRHILDFRCNYTVGSVIETARDADISIVASGSASLQVAAAGCPMIIMYQSSRLLWHLLGRWLLKTKYLSLVNILAKRQLVPEFMPYFTSVDPIVKTAKQLLQSRNKLSQTSSSLIKFVQPLCQHNASKNTAQTVIEMLSSTN